MPADTALHKAAYKGDYGAVEEYLEQNPTDVNRPGAQNRTPLHRAIGGGMDKMGIVELLLQAKADPNIPDAGGLTALHWAASFGYTSYGSVLLSAGAKVNAVTNTGESPLHFCAEKGYVDFAKLLLAREARTDIRDKSANGGSTPLDHAKRAKQKECIQLLQPPGGGGCCSVM